MTELTKRIARQRQQVNFWRKSFNNWRDMVARRTAEDRAPGYYLEYRDNALVHLAEHAGALRALLALRERAQPIEWLRRVES